MAKMTKEQAIELLKNRKVYVNGKSAEIQKKLFELGGKWRTQEAVIKLTGAPFLYICANSAITWDNDMEKFAASKFTEISAEEILAIEIVEPLKENDVVVSGWNNDTGSAKWVSVVKSGEPNEYDAKVVLILENTRGEAGAIQYDSMSETQEWTRPATEDEKQMLIECLKQEDSDDARSILKEVFGIEEKSECPLKPFDRVLVRDKDDEEWKPAFFWKKTNHQVYPYNLIADVSYAQCIAYEGNEHLLDTTNSPE